MKYKSCLLIAIISISGCASTYKLSEEGMKYRASLTDTDALNVVRKYTTANNEQLGVCGALTNEPMLYHKADPVAVNDPNLVFNSFYREMTGAKSAVSGGSLTTTMSYVMRKGTFKVNLRELEKIRIHSNNVNPFGCADRSEPGKIVRGYIVIMEDSPIGVVINVSEKNLAHLLAALTVLSPNAKLLEGAGL